MVVEALARELSEEGNIEILELPALDGIFLNGRVSRRDHIAPFMFAHSAKRMCLRPIEKSPHTGSSLPEETAESTRARIADVMLGEPHSGHW